jgi:hypothetical protein
MKLFILGHEKSHEGKHVGEGDEEESETEQSSSETLSGSGNPKESPQFGSGSQKRSAASSEDEFVNKIAILVTKKIYPRMPESIWNNYNLTSPGTSMVEPANTTPPIHYDNILNKDDENDIYGKNNCLNTQRLLN